MSQQRTERSKTKARKAPHQRSVRINITLPPAIYEAGQNVLSKYKFSGLSDYVANRIRKDAGLEIAA